MPTKPHRSLLHSRGFLTLAAVVVVVIVAIVLIAGRSSAPNYFTAPVKVGNITSVVQATGVVNPINTVAIGAQVSGKIIKINVDFNSKVKKGELIAQIDPSVYTNELAAAKSDLANAQASQRSAVAQVGVAQANVQAGQAGVEKAKAALNMSTLQRDRTVGLFQQGIVSAAQRDTDVATFQTDQASLASAQAGLAQNQASLKAAQAAVAQAQATVAGKQSAVQTAQTNLGYCNIYAPVDGVIINRAVDVGQTVASSFSAPLLFSEATDLNTMWVFMQTDESDEGRLQKGQPATFTVDAYPDTVYKGVVKQLRMNATTVQNVVEYDTIIEFHNIGEKLFPGMTAYVNIPVASATNTMEVPNSALRFKPKMTPVELRAVLAKYNIQPTGAAPKATTATDPAPKQAEGQHSGQAHTHAPAAGGQSNRPTTAILWTLDGNKNLVPVRVRTGITDFTNTAITKVLQGKLQKGDVVVTGELAQAASGLPGATGGRGR